MIPFFHKILFFFQKTIFRYFGIFLSPEFFRKSKLFKINEFLNTNRPVKTINLIRVGPKRNGGYLVPDCLNTIKYSFSPGVGGVVDFDLELANDYGIKTFFIDNSLSNLPVNHKNFNFLKYNLNSFNDNKNITIKRWIEISGVEDDNNLLQMDIEGSEYDVLINTSIEELKKFKILIIEFHRFEMIFTDTGFRLLNSIFNKLRSEFNIVHIHPNDCCGSYKKGSIEIPRLIEYTFLRKDISNSKGFINNYPNPLDHGSLTLPNCFFK